MEWNYVDLLPEKSGFYWVMGLDARDEEIELPGDSLKDASDYITVMEVVENAIWNRFKDISYSVIRVPGIEADILLDNATCIAWAGPIKKPTE